LAPALRKDTPLEKHFFTEYAFSERAAHLKFHGKILRRAAVEVVCAALLMETCQR
jgi:hypothetical protein